jgi:hypothetical protein
VIADSLWAALEGRKALKVEWDDMRIERLNTDQLYARMKEDLKKHALSQRSGGNADGVFERTENKVEAIYETPYEAHACMEPLTVLHMCREIKLKCGDLYRDRTGFNGIFVED